MPITMTVNGEARTLDVEPEMPLLWAFRETLGLAGQVRLRHLRVRRVHRPPGRPRRTIVHAAMSAAEGKRVTTIEGLAPDATLHQVLQAWIAHQVKAHVKSSNKPAIADSSRASSRPSVIPPNAVLTAELSVISERAPG